MKIYDYIESNGYKFPLIEDDDFKITNVKFIKYEKDDSFYNVGAEVFIKNYNIDNFSFVLYRQKKELLEAKSITRLTQRKFNKETGEVYIDHSDAFTEITSIDKLKSNFEFFLDSNRKEILEQAKLRAAKQGDAE